MNAPRRHSVLPALVLVAVVLVPVLVLLAVLVSRARRTASRTRASEHAHEVATQPAAKVPATDSAQPAATDAAAAPRRRRRTPNAIATIATCLGLLVLGGMPTTWATLNDSVTMAQVSATAGTVNAPTGLTLTDTGSAIRLSWTAPGAGLTPDSYDVWRTTTSGSYGGSPDASPTASPWNDPTAAQCTDYWYRVNSRRVNLTSGFTAEAGPINVDWTNPTIGGGNVVFDATPLPAVADFVRASGGDLYVYANVSDNCSSGANLAVEFQFGAPFNSTAAATPGSWTPVSGGPSYNYRWGPYTLPGGTLTNNQTVSWTIQATDQAGNVSTAAGTTLTADGASPTGVSGEMVSAFTNYYDSATLGMGEIPSDGTARATGSYVYGTATDASGIASITANLDVSVANRLKTGSTAVPLTEGSYSVGILKGTQVWSWRSAAQVINTGLADGTRNFTLTVTDKVGNAATTSGNLPVEIDDTAIRNTGACTHAGNASNTLNSGDSTSLNLADTIWPEAFYSGWDGNAVSTTAVFRNSGTSDLFDFNTDFGISLFRGSTATTAFAMGATNWVTANVNIPNTTMQLSNRTTLQWQYGTPATAITDRNRTATMHLAGANIRDAAGNVSANFTEACATTAW